MKRSPYDEANFISKILFLYASPFLKKPNDKFYPPGDLKSDTLSKKIIEHWAQEVDSQNPKFFNCLVKAVGWEFALINIPLTLEFISFMALSFSVGQLALYYYSTDPSWIGLVYSTVIVLSLIIMRICRNYAFFRSDRLGIRLKYALLRILFQKLCKISHEIVNSSDISVSVSNLTRYFLDYLDYFTGLDYLFIAPVAWIVICIYLYMLIGYAGVVGVGILALSMPVQAKFNSIANKLQQRTQKLTEAKLKLITETFDGIKVIKSNIWEHIFLAKILEKREQEMKLNQKLMIAKGINVSLKLFSQIFSSIITFSILITSGDTLTIDKTFYVISLIYLCDAYIATMLPVATDIFMAYLRGCRSFQKFLLQKERIDIHKKTKKGEIQLRDIVSYWSEDSVSDPQAFRLSHISLEIQAGDMCVLYGPTGSGKTALLLTMIGEIFIQHGSVYRGGKVAYVQQEPWIYSGTIRDNITLGKEFNEDLYVTAINYSMLTDDLAKFPKADMTTLGEKGFSISGGQRCRIGLARAVYSKADIYIFDNTLGSLDLVMTKEIINGLIIGYLRGKTRILATYLTDFVQEWMKVIKIERGSLKVIKGMEITEKVSYKKKSHFIPGIPFKYKTSKFQTLKEGTGSANFFSYWRKVGYFYLVILLIMYLGSGALQTILIYYLTEWSSSQTKSGNSFEIILITAISLLVVVFIRNILLALRLVSCANQIHNKVIENLLFTSIDFFETGQKTKILKRFNSDFGIIDQQLPQMNCEIFQLSFLILSSCITIIISNPYVLIIFVLIVIALILNLKQNINNIVSLYQNNNSSKIPIQNQIITTSQGIFALRSYKLLSKFQQVFNEASQKSFTHFFNYFSAIKFLNITNECILILMVLGHTFLSVFIKDSLDPALLATSLSFIVNMLFTAAYLFALVIRMTSSMTSVSYMSQCSQFPTELESDGGNNLEVVKGAILFQDVELLYENGNVGLSRINFELKGGQRHGIVGKSGSGKSSLISALMRFYEISSGKMFIDGQDLSDVNLRSLRKSISIVPQTPIIFDESIRFNIDPEGIYEDNEIWLVLRLVEMDVKVMTLIGSLDAVITTGSLSIGEKQLISLARSMIKRSKILLLDEIMANVDYSEEMRLYDSIESMNSGCTVLIITHRLDSLISCNSIMMLSSGNCVECGNPKVLLANRSSMFYVMAKASDGGLSSLRPGGLISFMSKNGGDN